MHPQLMFELPDDGPCSFCEYIAGTREVAIVAENDGVVAFVNKRQYEQGSLLVVPRAHRTTILDIDGEEIAAVYQFVQVVAKAAAVAYSAVGMSVFQNNGVKSGQSQPHFHVHVVPRYETSNPERKFRSQEFEVLSIDEQRVIADRIREYL